MTVTIGVMVTLTLMSPNIESSTICIVKTLLTLPIKSLYNFYESYSNGEYFKFMFLLTIPIMTLYC